MNSASPGSQILRETRGHVATITLNRPEKHNAILPEMFDQFGAQLQAIAGEADHIHVVILRGAGRSFCAGLDLHDVVGAVDLAWLRQGSRTLELFSRLPQIVIAAVHGYCFTGGLELALAADLIVTCESATFGDTHARLGLVPMWGGSQRLPRRVGTSKAIELMTTGRRIGGREAERIGLANQCLPDVEFEAGIDRLVEEILANSFHGNSSIKRLVHETDGMRLSDGIAHEQFRSPGSQRRDPFQS
ncbi:enoyl-CoA hydratase/isomerase family protein [Rhodopseudomonas sp. P2A-2r]|uniref:enoyl-CoA hydratase/isomerase family protein n=1 Tax=unclassified Rhodopseudomonas TaxID=2638247 RepID=UPI002234A7E7|nr:enoyl-CoA hydratase/isomerase family protein [Rhodopseudomonas sp. P2A-2r]UZE47876.1 enoyl-CoA hydratase/isomerase family protein [Rhodopseudomonas sp. P2A-2r]